MFSFFKKKATKDCDTLDYDTVEEYLIDSDIDYDICLEILDGFGKNIKKEKLKVKINTLLEDKNAKTTKTDINIDQIPFVQLIIGINGAGKTTTIAKLANMYIRNNNSVILGAGDTFRAAAIEQLTQWAKKLGVPIIKTQQGHDPSAVAYDTISSAISKKIDKVIIDTAGRLQTQTNLNKELQKIVKVCNKALPQAPHEKILVIDGTQGISGYKAAKAFDELINIDGIIITKLDGSAGGGIIFSILKDLDIPILYIGTGEKIDDLEVFDKQKYIDNLIDSLFVS